MKSEASNSRDPHDAFIEAAVWHGSLNEAEAILSAHPRLADHSIYVAAILGDDSAVRRFLARDPASVTAKGGPRGWDPLTHLCFSKYLRLDRARSEGFVRAATALLDAGADPNAGFYDDSHQPEPGFESALYAAAGVAHHAGVTRLLLDRGADPNDGEVAYHAPEGYDNEAMKALVGSGRLTADNLAIMLVRKADWHDLDGIRFLLEHRADPNRMSRWRFTALHQAVRRDNALPNIEAMLDCGADPALRNGVDGRSAIAMAARRGRGDLLGLFEQRGFPVVLDGVDRLIAACARDDAAAIGTIAEQEPGFVHKLSAEGGTLLAEFAGNGNRDGVRQLLDLGVNVGALYEEGDAYFGLAKWSTALHVAAWRLRPATVRLLIDRGAQVDVPDGRGRTPLALAVRACVDSYWSERRSTDPVESLLRAGASVTGVPFPSGYEDVDDLLREHGAKT